MACLLNALVLSRTSSAHTPFATLGAHQGHGQTGPSGHYTGSSWTFLVGWGENGDQCRASPYRYQPAHHKTPPQFPPLPIGTPAPPKFPFSWTDELQRRLSFRRLPPSSLLPFRPPVACLDFPSLRPHLHLVEHLQFRLASSPGLCSLSRWVAPFPRASPGTPPSPPQSSKHGFILSVPRRLLLARHRIDLVMNCSAIFP